MSISVVSAQSFCVRDRRPFVLYTAAARAHSLFNKLAPGRAGMTSRVSGWIVSAGRAPAATSGRVDVACGHARTDRPTDGHLASVHWTVTVSVTSLNGHVSASVHGRSLAIIVIDSHTCSFPLPLPDPPGQSGWEPPPRRAYTIQYGCCLILNTIVWMPSCITQAHRNQVIFISMCFIVTWQRTREKQLITRKGQHATKRSLICS